MSICALPDLSLGLIHMLDGTFESIILSVLDAMRSDDACEPDYLYLEVILCSTCPVIYLL